MKTETQKLDKDRLRHGQMFLIHQYDDGSQGEPEIITIADFVGGYYHLVQPRPCTTDFTIHRWCLVVHDQGVYVKRL